MAGVYLHIPYCKQACHYCDFHFSTNLKTRTAMINAMLQEMNLRRNFLPDEPIHTIYFGGGTPSLLEISDLKRLMDRIRALWTVSADAEITLEANPDDLTPEVLEKLKAGGINRLSIGIQSFFQEHLEWMNRGHNAQQALQCITDARAAGFDNLSVDLIYGFPLLSDEQWKQNIDRVIALRLPHISCYSLTVEQGTALDKFIRSGKQSQPDDEQSVRHFEMLTDALRAAGYDHYEVSNFALPGFVSRHNHSYWTGAGYLGIGPSAHSFNGRERCWNVRNNQLYIRQIADGSFAPECETITGETAYNEYILTRMRTAKGIDTEQIKQQFDIDFNTNFKPQIDRLLQEKKLINDGSVWKLTRQGFLWADDIAAQFFIINE